MDESYTPQDTFYTSAAVAEELGLSRAAVSDAVKRGTLSADAVLVSPKNSQVPIFRHATIERYRANHLRQHGNRPASNAKKEASMHTLARIRIILNASEMRLMHPGFLEGIQSLEGELKYAISAGLDSRPIASKLDRVRQIAEIHEREMAKEADISENLSSDTMKILLAATALSARIDEEEVERLAAAGKSTLIIEQLATRAAKTRDLFPEEHWEGFGWEEELRTWGL